MRLSFPNPFPREYGLPTSRGIASYRCFPAIYQAWRIRELLRMSQGGRVLEIGAGLGRTAYYARGLGINDYTIADLPLANVSQALFLGHTLGPDAIWLLGDDPAAMAGRIRIYSPHWFFSSDERFSLVLNADSLTEIDQSMAVRYFKEIARRSSLFVSINWDSFLRAWDLPGLSGVPVRPLRFPYWLRWGYAEELFVFDCLNRS